MSKSKPQKDSSKIFAVSDLSQEYQDSSLKIQLQKYEEDNVRLIEEIKDLKHALSKKDEQVKHLEQLLKQAVSTYVPVQNMPVTDEEVIALKQLERLKEASQIRPLSLEEIKMYDLLVKNKRLSQGQATGVIDTVKLPKERPKLIEIASKKIDEPTEE